MLEPTTFEIAKSGEPNNADLRLIINSGAEVANETTVIPIKILGKLNRKEIETADFNKKFPPKTRRISPDNNKKKVLKSIFYN